MKVEKEIKHLESGETHIHNNNKNITMDIEMDVKKTSLALRKQEK